MSLAIVYSRAQVGIHAPLVSVEVHLSGGLPGLFIVGLPEAAVKESKDRVRGALLNSQLEFPSRRITINLAPADLPKEGGRFDLPIALGILAASGQLNRDRLRDYEFLGELALGGDLRAVRGVLPAALACRDAARTLLVPEDNTGEATLVGDVAVLGAAHLLDVRRQLETGTALQPPERRPRSASGSTLERDLSDVRGQHHAKRALEIAAAGGHNLLLIGPPGTGKTMLASRLPGILPPLSETEALETAAIASVSAQGLDLSQWGLRPFRAPHHTASAVALVGGGSQPRPGEISLAHHGAELVGAGGVDEVFDGDHHAPGLGWRRGRGGLEGAGGAQVFLDGAVGHQALHHGHHDAATHGRQAQAGLHIGERGHLAPQRRACGGGAHDAHLVDGHAARPHPVGQGQLG